MKINIFLKPRWIILPCIEVSAIVMRLLTKLKKTPLDRVDKLDRVDFLWFSFVKSIIIKES